MRRRRRKAFIRFFERAALGMAVLDVVVYLAIVRPLHRRIVEAESSYHRVLEQVQQRQDRVARLVKFQENLPQADEQLKAFLTDHVPTRRHAFSEASRMVRVLTNQSGVQLDNVSYKLTSEKGEPLERLRINVVVEGPFSNLLKFAHTLESAPQLILLKNFTFSTNQGSLVSLQVGAELYLTP
ncbi:MAG TPA: type 4a pilus biogenesis protein PilO [Terriglobia bacterium]|nr:type 4a pilus biogenesis protein PilO [Terriglobia bacterium]